MIVLRLGIELAAQLDDIRHIQVDPSHPGATHTLAAAVQSTAQMQDQCNWMSSDELTGISIQLFGADAQHDSRFLWNFELLEIVFDACQNLPGLLIIEEGIMLRFGIQRDQ